jgi:two-component sensor histidine kinase
VSPGINSLSTIKDIQLKLYHADSARGNYLSAINHLRIYQTMNDSIFNVTKSKQIQEVTAKYETEKKEQNIKLLENESKLQQNKLLQASYTRNWIIGGAALLFVIVILLVRNITLKQRVNKKLKLQGIEIEKQNDTLRHLVNEKDWLLKEIHHRVKNNLQIVMSLLNSQSAFIDDDAALTAINDSQHRVHAMSLIHQKLYGSENVSSIDMSFYIRELVSYLADSFNTGQLVRFEYDIDSFGMDVSQAVPLGLILNEAITNSIKYAFPEGRNGVISIVLKSTDTYHYLLKISDNGIGIPSQFKNKKPGSLGLSLITGLSEDLDGSLSIENNNGTAIKISFAHDLRVKRSEISALPLALNN